jgi:tetratricopeptide (TPR) repeat protein
LTERPVEERAVIDWLAVAGGPVASRVLGALGGAGAEDATARLCARGLCDVRHELVDVRHPLTRDVAYLGLDKATRLEMHRKLGEHLADSPLAHGLSAAIVARHLARGGARSAAAAHYLEAANTARDSYQTQLATRYLKRALRILPRGDLRRLEVHEALESIARVQGRWQERRRHLVSLRRMARQSKDPWWVCRALLRTALLEQDQGYLARGLTSAQLAERVARQAGSPEIEVHAQSLTSELLRDLGDMQGALAACDRALAVAARPDVPARLRADVLRTRGTLLRRVGRVDEAVDAHAEAIAIFKQVGARRSEASAKHSLALALFVLGRFEDAIALSLDAIRIDLAIGGRIQIARTLSTIGQCYARLGDPHRGLAYLRRAREAHERYGDHDARPDTLLATAEVVIELGDLAAADCFLGDASGLIAVSGSAYDSVHEKIVRALIARASGDSRASVMHAFDARQAAEAQAYVAYHFYAMAIEAAARCDIGEQHTGILLATTAIGAMETIQGSEYGLETRAICCEAMQRAGSPQAAEMQRRSAAHARRIHAAIHDPHFSACFLRRSVVRFLIGDEPEASPERASPPPPGPDAERR